jgi:LTXXQ motif family protein
LSVDPDLEYQQLKGVLTMGRLNQLLAAAGGLSTLLMVSFSCCALASMERNTGLPHASGRVLLAQAQPAQPPQNIETVISELRQRLQVTPAQEAQFGAVANVMRDNARAEASAAQQPPGNATAVDDLRAFIKYSELELTGLKKMLPALEALYATLSPAQKKAADAVFRQGG